MRVIVAGKTGLIGPAPARHLALELGHVVPAAERGVGRTIASPSAREARQQQLRDGRYSATLAPLPCFVPGGTA
jgi:hypothetical protein